MAHLIMERLGPLPRDNSVVPARLIEIEGLERDLDYGYGRSLRFVFQITKEEFSRRKASVITSCALNELSNLYQIVRPILGRNEIEDGEDIAEALLNAIGNDYRIVVRYSPSPETGMTFLEVIEIEACQESTEE